MNSKCLATLVLFFLCLLFPGCMDITGRGPAPLTKTVGVATEQYPRVGHVYCMRGWLGIFSTGMDTLADEIDKQVGAPAVSVADEEWRRLKGWLINEYEAGKIHEPLVLLGHSWGADDSIRVCQELQEKNITVDLLVLIDPVTPPPVPTNVKRVYCVYKSHPVTDTVPFWRGVPATVVDKNATPLVNVDLRTDKVGFDTESINHINIEKNEDVHHMVMEQIKQACPTRIAWEQMQRETPRISQRPNTEKYPTISQ